MKLSVVGIMLSSLMMLYACGLTEHSHKKTSPLPDWGKLEIRSLNYLSEQGWHYDSYGLLLPKTATDFKDQGDALLWNSIALAVFCLIGESEKIIPLWEAVKGLQTEDGRLFRHPSLREGRETTSISKDGVIGFLFLGAMAYESQCSPVMEEYGERLHQFSVYVKAHNYEMGEGITDLSVTFLSDRHLLRSVLQLYDRHDLELDYKTSLHDLSVGAETAAWTFNNKFLCDFVDHSQFICPALEQISVFPNHLTFLSIMTAYVDWEHNDSPLHTLNELKQYANSLARSGIDVGFPNFLFMTGSQIINGTENFDEIADGLNALFPAHLPSESNAVAEWGCTDYIWQRLPKEPCNQSDKEYLGLDYLLPYALMHFYRDAP